MKYGNDIIKRIEHYLSGNILWKEFGDYFEDLMFKNDNFQDILPEKIVLILEDILSDIEYSDYTGQYVKEDTYLIDEKEFKKRLKNNLKKLKNELV